MISKNKFLKTAALAVSVVFIIGCANGIKIKTKPKEYPVPDEEAEWIKKGEPVEFEEELWYPSDNIENLLDAEVYMVGEYKEVLIFVEKVDVRPYSRLYTKFGKNKFRFFEKR